ncbi:MAG: class I tRNA ligase family protein [Cyclobacteriaceae bacterium]
MTKYIVTIAPPTPNGDLHLGHIAGPFLAADIFARIRRLNKDEVFFTSYSDDYQDYVARKAVELGKEKFELARHFSQRMRDTFKKAEINLDCFLISYESEDYKAAIAMCYKGAKTLGTIGERIADVPYDEQNKEFGYEAFARGTCNVCGVESDASQCEGCAHSPQPDKMGVMKSVLSMEPMETVKKNREFLDIARYREFLRELYQDNPIRDELRDFISQVLESDNLEWYIDRPGGHGIDLEIGQEEKTIHTWFSGLAGYFAGSKDYWKRQDRPERHDYFWKDEQTHLVNFLGFDCSFSHAIVYPSLMSGLKEYTHRFTQLTNKFLKLEGGDFSTSRNHAIWADDLLKDYSTDGVRFYLALVSPEFEERNFELAKFDHWYNAFFLQKIAQLEKLLSDHEVGGKEIPTVPTNLNGDLYLFYTSWREYSTLETFSITGLAITLQSLLKNISQQIEEDENNEALSAALTYIALSEPIHPGLSERLRARYDIDNRSILEAFERVEVTT